MVQIYLGCKINRVVYYIATASDGSEIKLSEPASLKQTKKDIKKYVEKKIKEFDEV